MNDEPRARITHELKIWPEFFKQIRNGRMKFQLRRNDRDFQVGDELLLKEWDPEHHDGTIPTGGKRPFKVGDYTGRELLVRVDYIMSREVMNQLTNTPPTYMNFVIMSISIVS